MDGGLRRDVELGVVACLYVGGSAARVVLWG